MLMKILLSRAVLPFHLWLQHQSKSEHTLLMPKPPQPKSPPSLSNESGVYKRKPASPRPDVSSQSGTNASIEHQKGLIVLQYYEYILTRISEMVLLVFTA